MNTQLATFGAGCFWGVEATFQKLPGVISTAVGYSGGNVANPNYEMVCSGTTGHAEVVQIQFDPCKTSYDQLLEIFWQNHDPTTRNRQGPDVGTQYRSVVLYHDESQRAAAEAMKARLDNGGAFKRPIVTEIVPYEQFFRAEEYHQSYLAKRGQTSCHAW